jgi:hypothetical protein
MTPLIVVFAGLAAANVFNTQNLLQKDTLNIKDFIKPNSINANTYEPQGQSIFTTSALGNKVKWSVFKHKSYPKHSLRVKTDVKLCDENVEQVRIYMLINT